MKGFFLNMAMLLRLVLCCSYQAYAGKEKNNTQDAYYNQHRHVAIAIDDTNAGVN